MKKQFINVMMTLAIVFGLSVSAMAQDGLTRQTALWHFSGATYTLSVDDGHTGTTFLWESESWSCSDAAAATQAAQPIFGTNTAATTTITYTDDAAGIYRFTVTETATDGGCITVREFFTAIMDVDVVVIASNSTETAEELSGADLASCNDYALRTDFTPDQLVPNVDDDDNTDNLPEFVDADLYNERWVQVTMTATASDLIGGCVDDSPSASDYHWMFDYTIAGTQYAGNADADDNNFTTMDAATLLGSGTGAVTYVTGATEAIGEIGVGAGTTSFIIPLQSSIRWGETDTDRDQSFTFEISNVLLSADAPTTVGDETEYTDGTESATNATSGNESAEQVIHASPATPRISIN